ncbi:hypothetical protein [Flectobacillus sp. BAB-3569]|uniref:hypothetical protein n=1 Tax=Flectobacillus sp. BAB-3569 TaxID=1509483 RepID=UPI000BA49B8A|nr:hypothetical protein [Flectobacillus sp. BAB-3569]PAC26941.1 hypothetical protein BWI92_23770 [Flectobacillus sp. BAB-3569]
MKKLIAIVLMIAAVIAAYFLGKTPKSRTNTTASNQIDDSDTTQNSSSSPTNNNAGNSSTSSSSSNTQNNGTGTNPDIVDTSKFYDYWIEKGEYIYLRKGGKTAVGNYAIGFLKDGRVVYTHYLNEGTPEETMRYSLSPEYLLNY